MISSEFKIIGKLYSEGFLKRILRLIDIYTSVSTTKKISILQPLQRVGVIKILVNLLILSNPSIKMLVIKIIQNMLKIGTPAEVFERAIDDFEKQGSSPRVL